MPDPSSAYLKCPFCIQSNNRILETRETKLGLALKRRRMCVNCERIFTTIEIPFDFLKHRLDNNLPTADALIEFLELKNGENGK